VLQQHAEDAAVLHGTRTYLTHAGYTKLLHLRRADGRLAAHLDGLKIAGEHAWPLCAAALQTPSSGAVFTASVRAIEDHRTDRLEQLFALTAAKPASRSGLWSALGWLEASQIGELAARLLASSHEAHRTAGLTAFALHHRDPGIAATRLFEDASPLVRARAWRAAGEIGLRELVSTAAAAIVDEDPACLFWASWSAVLLGDRHNALEMLASLAAVPGPFRKRAFQLVLQAKGVQSAHGWLSTVATDAASLRWLIRGAGWVGDPHYVPWLIGHMAEIKTTRLAGEAFSLITGLDLAWLDLEVKPPENVEFGPNDDPNNSNVDMDEDHGLPWPDAAKIQGWWQANSPTFQPGTRYFMGEPLNRETCLRVLKRGFQRQRIAAALYLSLLNPGTPLFEWRAPAWRQQRLLATMT
jgi:uncharacterized protein (TIGR02270 family)